jgi:Ca2+-binding RTX toxin-like protein
MAVIPGTIYNDNNTVNGGFIPQFRPALLGTAFADTIDGRLGNDLLIGLGGNDTLIGGEGIDTMRGGTNDDTYVVDNVLDKVEELAGQGIDTVEASVSYTLSDHVENLTLIGNALNATGNSLNNVLTGNALNNLLDGKTGADIMKGGMGADTYIVDNVGDQVIELSGQGVDTVKSSISYTLGTFVENLELTGFAYQGVGNSYTNLMIGNSYSNLLDGGAGADTMRGGLGNDIYIVDNAGDKVEEALGQGIDTVRSSISYTLTDNVENLELMGSAYSGMGNSLGNRITGNSFNNHLDGKLGIDTMRGGQGNDFYVVDIGGDKVEEFLNEGIDTVSASVSYTLSDHVENLILTGTAYSGLGNSLGNEITGNSYSNYLDGKAGADTMKGGLGDDLYVVDNIGDKVEELAGQGSDRVFSSISKYTLTDHVENLTLTGTAYEGNGNNLNNDIVGNNSANYLTGGAGFDTISGGGGNDALFGGANGDKLMGEAGNDRLNGFGGGTLIEIDTLHGGAGFDRYILGNKSSAFYTGSSQYAIISHWEAGIDKFEVFGSASQYTLEKRSVAGIGGSGLDTVIKFGSDVIAYVQDTTSVFASDLLTATV